MMVPPTIQRQLARLRQRERLLGLTWTVARCVALCAGLLVGACLIDFFIDMRRDTPFWLRLGLLGLQVLAWASVVVLVVRAIAEPLGDSRLALWVERDLGHLGHRLISAVELNQPGAKTEGMSPELIAAVTRQAERESADLDFTRVAGSRRFLHSALIVGPLVFAGLLLLVLAPATAWALLARQLLSSRDIPRSVKIETSSDAIYPAGEEVTLTFHVTGRLPDSSRLGEVRVEPVDGGRATRVELAFDGEEGDGARYIARVPPADSDFTYRAWLKDGRMRSPGAAHLEPRPVVEKIEAHVQLPYTIGKKRDGGRFEEPQKSGDIVHRLKGARARVVLSAQKPITEATVEVLRKGDKVRRSTTIKVKGEKKRAELTFDLDEADVAYRVRVQDEFGFANKELPRRSIRKENVPPPEVVLLLETEWRPGDSGTPQDYEVEGLPVTAMGNFELRYECSALYGLSRALLRYRVVRKNAEEPSSVALSEEEFEARFPYRLPLGAPGERGAEKTKLEFYLLRADGPNKLDGTTGGGLYVFDCRGIPDGKGGLLELKEGDRIQFAVQVFGRDEPNRRPGRSVVREKLIVGQKELNEWMRSKNALFDRIKQLEDRQKANTASADVP